MVTTIKKQTEIKKITKDLKTLVNKSRKKLFEFETLASAWEIKEGKSKIFNNPQEFFGFLKK